MPSCFTFVVSAQMKECPFVESKIHPRRQTSGQPVGGPTILDDRGVDKNKMCLDLRDRPAPTEYTLWALLVEALPSIIYK